MAWMNSSEVCRVIGMYHSSILNRLLDESHDLRSWVQDKLRSCPQGAIAFHADPEALLSSLELYSKYWGLFLKL